MKTNIFNAVENADKHGIAIEALIQAETQFLNNENINEDHSEIDDFTQMAFKHDDGFWMVTGSNEKYTYNELIAKYPGLG